MEDRETQRDGKVTDPISSTKSGIPREPLCEKGASLCQSIRIKDHLQTSTLLI